MSNVQLIIREYGSHIIEKLETASTICILTSFVMKSGVKFLKDALKRLLQMEQRLKFVQGLFTYNTA